MPAEAGFRLRRDLQWQLPPARARTLPMLSQSRGLSHEGQASITNCSMARTPDACLQGRNGEGLGNRLCGLGLDNAPPPAQPGGTGPDVHLTGTTMAPVHIVDKDGHLPDWTPSTHSQEP